MSVIEYRHRPLPVKNTWLKGRKVINVEDNVHWKFRPDGKRTQQMLLKGCAEGHLGVYADGKGGFTIRFEATGYEFPIQDFAFRDDFGAYRQSDFPFLLQE